MLSVENLVIIQDGSLFLIMRLHCKTTPYGAQRRLYDFHKFYLFSQEKYCSNAAASISSFYLSQVQEKVNQLQRIVTYPEGEPRQICFKEHLPWLSETK